MATQNHGLQRILRECWWKRNGHLKQMIDAGGKLILREIQAKINHNKAI